MSTWVSVVEQVGVTFCCLAALGMWIAKYIKTKDEKETKMREQEVKLLLEQQQTQREYFIEEIKQQRELFSDTINNQTAIYSETIDKFDNQLQNLTRGLDNNREELKSVHSKLDKIEDDIKEIKFVSTLK